MRAKFNAIRAGAKGAAWYKNQSLAEYMFEELNSNLGKFYKSNGRIYYLVNETHEVLLVPYKKEIGDLFCNLFMDWFRFAVGDNNFDKVYQQIYLTAEVEAPETIISSLSYYDPVKNVLYVSDNNNEMYVLNGTGIEKEDNGYDNVLFFHSDYTPISADLEHYNNEIDLFDQLYFDKIWFDGNKDNQKTLLKEWFFSLFFPGIQKQKPLLIIIGDTGSGKTATIEAAGILVQGQNFMTISITDSETDFINNLYNNSLLAIDNIDGRVPKWFEDRITSISTGGGISVRGLYRSVDAPLIKFKPQVFIAATSREARFNRDDLSNRSIILKVTRPEQYGTPLQRTMLENRNTLWATILNQLNERIANLGRDAKEYESSFRITEFVSLACRANNDKDRILAAFESLAKEQGDFNVAQNGTFEVLMDFVKSGDAASKWWTASDLYEFFSKSGGKYPPIFKSNVHVGRSISRISGSLGQYIYFQKSVKDGVQTYFFAAKDQPSLLDHGNSDLVEQIFT